MGGGGAVGFREGGGISLCEGGGSEEEELGWEGGVVVLRRRRRGGRVECLLSEPLVLCYVEGGGSEEWSL